MPKKYETEEIKLAKLILKGYMAEKTIKKFSNTSGVIFVPKRFIGQKFKMILIPFDDINEWEL